MSQLLELVMAPESANDPEAQRHAAAELLGVDAPSIVALRLRKRSIDARGGRVKIRLQAEVFTGEAPPDEELPRPDYRQVRGEGRVVIVGSGPAGMFAALRLIELGVRPIILERGKDVRARRRDLVGIQRMGVVNADSNYCFGEGGAGTYSDGKLYTRSTKRGDVAGALRTLVAHGASPDILVDAHPHIGSNILPHVVSAMRQSIIEAGGEVRFDARVVDLVLDAAGRCCGVVTGEGDEVTGDAVILATGHSARDIYRLLHRRGVALEAKSFAMGIRIEHAQPLINRLQYKSLEHNAFLPAASYRLASTVEERGVYSFCMCPGGFIVPSATEPDEVVVNGMSLSRRDSPFANSGMVVSIETEDLVRYSEHGPLAGMHYQKDLETMAAVAGGGMQRAPAQRVTDFIAGNLSASLPASSYNPGLTSAPLHRLLPASIAERLRQGFRIFGKTMRGYVTEEAVVVGVESRTSSPVRIPRDAHTLEHPTLRGLYPSGEGGGYAGGIISAALDGVRVADAVTQQIYHR